MEFVNRDHASVEILGFGLFEGETQSGVRADECGIWPFQEPQERRDFRFVAAGCAQVVRGFNVPIREEAIGGEVGGREGCADGAFRDGHDHLAPALVEELIERNKHECTRLPGGWRSFDKQILGGALFIGTSLHFPHPELIGGNRFPGLRIGHVHNVFGGHGYFPSASIIC